MEYDAERQIQAAKETDHLYQKVKKVVPHFEWALVAPMVQDILRLKKERGAVILAHNYMNPIIYHCLADVTGDSLQLAKVAATRPEKIIIQAGVHFMAETSKIICPDKTVLIPDPRAGCSLAESITAQNVRDMKELFPGAAVVCYVNSSAEVKAESDACCTSSNALRVVDAMDSDTVIMIPDKYLAENTAKLSNKRIVWWDGRCIVHELFNTEEVAIMRNDDPRTVVIAHPECNSDVVDAADFSGSTSAMSEYITKNKPKKVFLITECSMSSNLETEHPETTFVRACHLCPHMQRITISRILDSLTNLKTEVFVAPEIAFKARQAIDKMLEVG